MSLCASLGAGALRFSARVQVPQVKKNRRPTAAHNWAGYGYTRTLMEFMKWAHEQRHFPSTDAVVARFNVSRATAYRWTYALAETYGIAPESRNQLATA